MIKFTSSDYDFVNASCSPEYDQFTGNQTLSVTLMPGQWKRDVDHDRFNVSEDIRDLKSEMMVLRAEIEVSKAKSDELKESHPAVKEAWAEYEATVAASNLAREKVASITKLAVYEETNDGS